MRRRQLHVGVFFIALKFSWGTRQTKGGRYHTTADDHTMRTTWELIERDLPAALA